VKVNELKPISGNSEGSYEVEFRPLNVTEHPKEHKLVIATKQLGTFTYNLRLQAGQPLSRQTLRFNVPLGTMQTEQFIFHAFNHTKAEYKCSVTKADFFTVQNTIVVEPVANGWDGDDVRVNVMFEPTEVGEVRDLLTLSSKEGGTYECELVATCIAPIPRGPFNFEQGSITSIDISFRNCFTASCNWNFSVDSPAFRVAAPSATVNAKTEGKCTVLFEATEENVKTPGGTIMGKLFITCASQPSLTPWVYYLRAKVDPNLPIAPAGGKKK
jgi:hydrocephalus-inducing protein